MVQEWVIRILPRSGEWTVRCLVDPDVGLELTAAHPLSLGISYTDPSWTGGGLDELARRYESRLRRHPEVSIVSAAPPVEHVGLVVDLRHLLFIRHWGPADAFDLCGILMNHGFLTVGEAEWLVWYCSEGAPMRVEKPLLSPPGETFRAD